MIFQVDEVTEAEMEWSGGWCGCCPVRRSCFGLFSAAVTESLRPSNLQGIVVYLTHGSGGWEV